MYDTSNRISDELDLGELFGIMWAHKILIAIITLISLSLGIQYYITAQKKYRSIAIFEIDYGEQGGLNLGGELGSLAQMAGLGLADTSSELLLERLRSREFIFGC